MLLILMVKKGLKKHISVGWQYNVDLLFLILLIVPFIPTSLLSFINMGSWIFSGLRFGQTGSSGADAIAEGGTGAANSMNWLQDFTMSVTRTESGYIAPILTIIWLAGIVVFIIFTFFCNRKLRLVKKSMKPIEAGEIAALFSQCKAE